MAKRKKMMEEKLNPDDAKDTGHEWDGIRELKNAPPGLWVICFYLAGLWLIVYFVLYPAIPLISDFTRGLTGWSQIEEYKIGMEELEAVRAPFEKRIIKMSAHEILKNPEISGFAVKSSRVLFGDKCAACHGSGGQGTPGFPILADDDWLYGGTLDNIIETITDGREGFMPGFYEELTRQELNDLVKFIMDLPGGKVFEPGRMVFLGETESESICYSCHGEDAKGIKDFGSANLTDNIWRFDGTEEGIRRTIMHGVNNEDDPLSWKALMPAFGEKLTEDQIKKLAVKVFLLGGGQEPEEEG